MSISTLRELNQQFVPFEQMGLIVEVTSSNHTKHVGLIRQINNVFCLVMGPGNFRLLDHSDDITRVFGRSEQI
jgi:hypothetical protein